MDEAAERRASNADSLQTGKLSASARLMRPALGRRHRQRAKKHGTAQISTA
jgi:hypothetical protein